jgi:hypothetical protein
MSAPSRLNDSHHPRRCDPSRLTVEQLEDRSPASTTLDMLLADLWRYCDEDG